MTDPAIDPGGAKTTRCKDEHDPTALLPQAALARIKRALTPITGTETMPIRAALGRILAADLRSAMNVPAGTNSAMDGYAVNSADMPAGGQASLRLVGTAWAGRPFSGRVAPGSCVRIMTGALLPEGADTVIIQENAQRQGEQIIIQGGTRPSDNVRRAGEDIAIGDVILTKGRRLNPADSGLLASIGIAEVTVYRRVRVAFFSTGDELQGLGQNTGEPLAAGHVYDSNRYTLHGMLTRLGVERLDLGIVRDVREEIEHALTSAAANADVIITSGGVSVGEADLVKETLHKIGDVNFWKVAMKPGRPLAFGAIGPAAFFGLPGNPVSVMVTFYQFVQPALRTLMGEMDDHCMTVKVRSASALKKRPGRVEYQRGILRRNDDGALIVSKTGEQGSGILRSMSHANCFIILPVESTGAAPGDAVDVQPFYGLI